MNCLNSNQHWFIGKTIRQMLLDDSDIVSKIGNNVYPLVAPENTDGDFIVYVRDSYRKDTVQQGIYQDECVVSVIAVSDNYDSAVTLASMIDNCLSGNHIIDNKRIILRLSNSSEEYSDNKYIETLQFTIK